MLNASTPDALPGRSDITSLKGSTYPVGGIKYKLNQKVLYSDAKGNTNKELLIGTETEPVQVIAYSGLGAGNKFTSEYSKYSGLYRALSIQGTYAPYGYTNQTNPPATTQQHFIGVYNTGNPVAKNNGIDNTIEIENTDYVPADVGKNKWFYRGAAMTSNSKPFSTIAMQVAFPYEYLEKQIGEDNISANLNYILSVNEVEYADGTKQKVEHEVSVPWNRDFPGNIRAFAAFLDSGKQRLSSGDKSNIWSSLGDGITSQGNNLYASFYSSFTDPEATHGYVYGRWNANSFKYDTTKNAEIAHSYEGILTKEVYYGVGDIVPDDNLRTQDQIESKYTWYSSVHAAKAVGEISAVKANMRYLMQWLMDMVVPDFLFQ